MSDNQPRIQAVKTVTPEVASWAGAAVYVGLWERAYTNQQVSTPDGHVLHAAPISEGMAEASLLVTLALAAGVVRPVMRRVIETVLCI